MRAAVLGVTLATAALASCQRAEAPDDIGMQLAQAKVSAEEIIKNGLRDPGSAQFRDEHVTLHKNGPVVCGEVNSRNGFGGFAGFGRFITVGEKGAVDDQSESFEALWAKACPRNEDK